MLNRQKLLIFLLRVANRPVSRIELAKWCFLLRFESESRGGAAFYDFVPHLFGPRSFALDHELNKLVEQNLLCDDGSNHLLLNEQLATSIESPGKNLEQDAQKLLTCFLTKDPNDLINYVVQQYPTYTVNGNQCEQEAHDQSKLAIYTAGYEGLSIDAFLNLLVKSGIKRLIDVRNNPTARRYGFHKSTLRRLTKLLEIDYAHLPELGIRSEDRQNLTDQKSRDVLFDQYEQTTLDNEHQAIQQVERFVTESPSVLVCMESEPRRCHRLRLAVAVAKKTKLPTEHLVLRRSS